VELILRRPLSADAIRPTSLASKMVPLPFGGVKERPRQASPSSPCYTVSLAIGGRWAGKGEFYVAPKLGIPNGMEMPFPYQTAVNN
jgi:hypothetical protein